MPALVRLYIRHCVYGFLIAAIFVGLLLWLNVANLWHLVTHAEGGVLAVILLIVFNGIVFSGVQFGIAVMRFGDDAPTGGPRRATPAAPAPAAVAAKI